MAKPIVIIGAGITGIVTGYLLQKLDPDVELAFYDAGPEPTFPHAGVINHYGATLGHSRDARHFTGTEGLSFQNPVHTELLFEMASSDGAGWQAIPEDDLTDRERNWREECLDRYRRHVKPEYNPYDAMYTALNYGGMAGWDLLAALNPELLKFKVSDNGVHVAFGSMQEMQADLKSETTFNPWQATDTVQIASLESITPRAAELLQVQTIHPQLLRVPGQAWKIKSLWQYVYKELSAKPTVRFHWGTPITTLGSLPAAEAYVWAAGSAYVTPDIYVKHGRVQGIGGWWTTLPNPGFTAPFKFSAPQPSGYINFTPVDDVLHISGGFSWVGEREYSEAEQLLQPAKEQFIKALASFLTMPEQQIRQSNFGCCIRPTTPTGLPDIKTHTLNNKPHITISGAGKAGATEAPLLAMHVATELGFGNEISSLVKGHAQAFKQEIIQQGLAVLHSGLEP